MLPAGPELAGPVTAYLQRSWDFLKAFEPPREEAYFTQEYQQALLEEEARAREAGTGFRFYIQPVGGAPDRHRQHWLEQRGVGRVPVGVFGL